MEENKTIDCADNYIPFRSGDPSGLANTPRPLPLGALAFFPGKGVFAFVVLERRRMASAIGARLERPEHCADCTTFSNSAADIAESARNIRGIDATREDETGRSILCSAPKSLISLAVARNVFSSNKLASRLKVSCLSGLGFNSTGTSRTGKPATVATGFDLGAERGAEAVILKACLEYGNCTVSCQCMIR